jgi:hypothetical protein
MQTKREVKKNMEKIAETRSWQADGIGVCVRIRNFVIQNSTGQHRRALRRHRREEAGRNSESN